jgi:Ni,Fe-hydrogenase I large subunit
VDQLTTIWRTANHDLQPDPLGSGFVAEIASGYGWHEAPRGSLGHWVEIDGKAIKNYQAVVPTTWNAGPRDAQGQRGAYEAALLNTPVADPNRPLEILRTIHSFDPVHRLRGACHRRSRARVHDSEAWR